MGEKMIFGTEENSIPRCFSCKRKVTKLYSLYDDGQQKDKKYCLKCKREIRANNPKKIFRKNYEFFTKSESV
jgi:DNA-directed RNA polymerase subunit N (RpoN/RPB10)